MEFGSILFLCVFFPFFFFLYYLMKEKWRNIWLLIGSMAFVICGRNAFIWYFLLITGITYFGLSKLNCLPKNISKKKILVWIICLEIVIFCFFIKDMKVNQLIIYPICYMITLLSNIGTLLDFYKNKRRKPNLFHYVLYSSCFSKLLFGPVLSYYDMEDEIKNRVIKRNDIIDGCYLFLRGIFLNVVLVGMLCSLKDELFKVPSSFVSSWILVITTMLQIVLFMMSYSNMSVGLSKMLGFHFTEETNYPLCLSKMKYFFSTWHSSISVWWDTYFKIKLLFPIQIFLFMIVLSTCYGLNYLMILWFLFIGLGILIEELWLSKKKLSKKIFYFLHFVWLLLSFVILVRPNILETASSFLKVPFWEMQIRYLLSSYGMILIVSFLIVFQVLKKLTDKVKDTSWYHIGRMVVYIILLWIVLIALVSGIHSSIWNIRI